MLKKLCLMLLSATAITQAADRAPPYMPVDRADMPPPYHATAVTQAYGNMQPQSSGQRPLVLAELHERLERIAKQALSDSGFQSLYSDFNRRLTLNLNNQNLKRLQKNPLEHDYVCIVMRVICDSGGLESFKKYAELWKNVYKTLTGLDKDRNISVLFPNNSSSLGGEISAMKSSHLFKVRDDETRMKCKITLYGRNSHQEFKKEKVPAVEVLPSVEILGEWVTAVNDAYLAMESSITGSTAILPVV